MLFYVPSYVFIVFVFVKYNEVTKEEFKIAVQDITFKYGEKIESEFIYQRLVDHKKLCKRND